MLKRKISNSIIDFCGILRFKAIILIIALTLLFGLEVNTLSYFVGSTDNLIFLSFVPEYIRRTCEPEWMCFVMGSLFSLFVSGGWFHLFVNLSGIAYFGWRLEDLWGFTVFITCYILCGWTGYLLYWSEYLWHLLCNDNYPIFQGFINSTGAIGGIIAASLVYLLRRRELKYSHIVVAAIWLLLQLGWNKCLPFIFITCHVSVSGVAILGSLLIGLLAGLYSDVQKNKPLSS
jgi:membrane associated rhomboid family serine protease